MKINKSMVRVLALAIILSIGFQSLGYAAGQVYKDETIYVNLDNKGRDENRYASVRLHSDSPLKKIEDKSILEDVKNVKGDEEASIEDGKIIWETDKKDIYYQGEVDKALPIMPEVKYYLDGDEVEAEDIAGESGELEIHISIENTDKRSIDLESGASESLYAPYIVATSLILPMDKFDNIEANTGKILSDGSNEILNFISLPGLEESLNIGKDILDLPNDLEIKADVVDFEMTPIVFTVTSEIPEMEDLDMAKDLEELLDGIDSIVEASGKLNEATEKLYQGQGDLNLGVSGLLNGLEQINEGTDPLYQGSLDLKDGIDSAYKGSLEINKGTDILSKSAKQLGEGFTALGDGTVEYSKKALEFSQGANKIAQGIGSIPENTKALGGGMEELIGATDSLKSGQDELTKGLNISLEALAGIKAGKEKEAQAIEMILGEMDNFDEIIKALESTPGGEDLALAMSQGVEKQRMALEGIESSSGQLINGLSQVEEGIKKAESGSKDLSLGSQEINAGQREATKGLKELNKGTRELASASKELEEASLGLEKGAGALKENALLAKEGVDKFTRGGNELAQGTHGLSQGLRDLSGGTNSLKDGVAELSKGSEELSQGGSQLESGSQDLLEGSDQLNQAMGDFNEDGIKEMDREVNSSDIDIKTTMERKDGLVDIAKNNTSFTGISEDMEGSLKFIMKTEGVKLEKEEVDIEVEEKEVEGRKSFIDWIKGLFK